MRGKNIYMKKSPSISNTKLSVDLTRVPERKEHGIEKTYIRNNQELYKSIGDH